MARFPYRFDQHGGPSHDGMPVIFSRLLHIVDEAHTFVVVPRQGSCGGYVMTSDPDFEWTFYRAECHEQARRIVRDGILRRVPWLRASI